MANPFVIMSSIPLPLAPTPPSLIQEFPNFSHILNFSPWQQREKVRRHLQSSDGEIFQVDLAVAKKSRTIAGWLEVEEQEQADFTPIHEVKGSVLAKVIEYCKNHVVEKEVEYGFKSKSDLDEFDEKFMEVDQDTIFDLIEAANYLDVKGLLDLGCRTVADMMKEKSIEQLRDTFNIKNDYSAEEEAEVKEEHAWAFK